jgi:two-component system sensor histidine kinase DegS
MRAEHDPTVEYYARPGTSTGEAALAGPTTGSPSASLERIYAQAGDSVRRDARRVQELVVRYRLQYRRRLDAWTQLQAGLAQRSTARHTGTALESLRSEHEQVGRELARLQGQLKRLDIAGRQLDLIRKYLVDADPYATEPSLTDADESPASVQLRIIGAQEGERQRLAADIHDGPAQVLTNAIFQVEYLDRVLDDSPRAARAELTFLRTMLREGLDEVRGFISNLRPPVVDVGLAKAITDQAAEFQARHGIAVKVSVNGIDSRLDPKEKASVLRILQEALQNVKKHAAASEVCIGFEEDQLTIIDNGRGFDVMRLASGASRNFGLQFMRERAELLGSQLQIESRQGEGTRILLRLPETSR